MLITINSAACLTSIRLNPCRRIGRRLTHSAFTGSIAAPAFVGPTQQQGHDMKRILLALVITAFAAGSAMAQSCESKAVGKDGKALAGAAKTSFLKKCKADACAGKAVGKDGKPLSGAAKNSFMTKCEKDA
jgi:hypothetical protein